MNKLTEIKRCLEVLDEPKKHSTATWCTEEDNLSSYGAEWLKYLLSLLEEKDKAFERIIEHYNSDGTDTLIAIKMLGEAQNSLLTSSNNEGDL